MEIKILDVENIGSWEIHGLIGGEKEDTLEFVEMMIPFLEMEPAL